MPFWFEVVLAASGASYQDVRGAYRCNFSWRFQWHHGRPCPTSAAGDITDLSLQLSPLLGTSPPPSCSNIVNFVQYIKSSFFWRFDLRSFCALGQLEKNQIIWDSAFTSILMTTHNRVFSLLKFFYEIIYILAVTLFETRQCSMRIIFTYFNVLKGTFAPD